MIRYKKFLTGLLTAALIFGSYSAVNASEQTQDTESQIISSPESMYDTEQNKTEENTETETAKTEESSQTTQTEPNSESEKNTETEPTSKSQESSETEPNSEFEETAETESTSELQESSETELNSESEKTTETESTSESPESSGTEPETEKNTESESESEENTETETQTESGMEPEETETQTETESVDDLPEKEPDSSVPADVFKVILPTIPEDDTTFDYILDPQGLIELTDAQKYGGTDEVEFEPNKTLYFKTSRTDNDRPVYDNVSNALTVTNMSSREVKITVKATITPSEGITMSENSTFDVDNTSTSIYLALTDGTNTIPITSEAAVLNTVIEAPKDAYEIVWDGEKNVYELTDAAKEDSYDGFQTYSFWLTGACNANADWSNVEGQIPEVYVIWEVE